MKAAREQVLGLVGAVMVAGIGGGGGGCAQGVDPARAGPTFPEIRQGQTLDIQVVRDSTVIRLTNTTARSFGPSRLWMNRWFSKPIERLDVGETLELSLWDFRDEHGEQFHAGGFFATRRPEPLVLAQLEIGGEMLGLVVVSVGEN